MDEGLDLCTTRELIKRLEGDLGRTYDRNTITAWTRLTENPMPVHYRGTNGQANLYDYDAVLEWLAEREQTAHEQSHGITDPRLEKARWEAEIARLRSLQLSGELIESSEIEPALETAILAARAQLLAAGEAMKAEIDARYGIDFDPEIYERRIHEALTQLSTALPCDASDDAQSVEAMGATAEAIDA